MIKQEPEVNSGSMKPGQDLLIAGYIGLAGTVQIARRMESELLKRFTKQFVNRCQQMSGMKGMNPEFWQEAGASYWREAGDGGIMAALWEVFEESNLGFEIELRKLPIRQETVEVCELFDINPYRLLSKECMILTAENGNDLVRILSEQGIHAVIIGKAEAGIKRQIYNGETRSFLDRPKPDELYKIQLTGG